MRFRVRISQEHLFFDTKEMTAEARRMAQHTSRAMKQRIRKSKLVSKPGAAPLGKTGRLRRSIGYKRVKGGGIGFWVGAREGGPRNRDGFHGRFLQDGTRKMASRDFVASTIKAERPHVERGLATAAGRSVKVKK